MAIDKTQSLWRISAELLQPVLNSRTQSLAQNEPLYQADLYTNIHGQSSLQVKTKNKALAELLTDFSFSDTPSLIKQLRNALMAYPKALIKAEEEGHTTHLAKTKFANLKTLLNKLKGLENEEISLYEETDLKARQLRQEQLRRDCVKFIREARKKNLNDTMAFYYTEGRLSNVLSDARKLAYNYQFTALTVSPEDQGVAEDSEEYGISSALAVSLPEDFDKENASAAQKSLFERSKMYKGNAAAYQASAEDLALALSALEHSEKRPTHNGKALRLRVVNQINRPIVKLLNWYNGRKQNFVLPNQFDKNNTAHKAQKNHHHAKPFAHIAATLAHGEGLWFQFKSFARYVFRSTLAVGVALFMGVVHSLIILPAWIAGHVVSVLRDFPEGWIAEIVKAYSPERYQKIKVFFGKPASKPQKPVHAPDLMQSSPVTHIKWLHAKHPYAQKHINDASLPLYVVKLAESLGLETLNWAWNKPITVALSSAMLGWGWAACLNPTWIMNGPLLYFGKLFVSPFNQVVVWSATSCMQGVIMGINFLENPSDSYIVRFLKFLLRHPLAVAALATMSYFLGMALANIKVLSAEFGSEPILAQTYLGGKGILILAETAAQQEKSLVGKILIFPFSLGIGVFRLGLALLGLGNIDKEFAHLMLSFMRAAQCLIEATLSLYAFAVYAAAFCILLPIHAASKLFAKTFGFLPLINKLCSLAIDLEFAAEGLLDTIVLHTYAWKNRALHKLESALCTTQLKWEKEHVPESELVLPSDLTLLDDVALAKREGAKRTESYQQIMIEKLAVSELSDIPENTDIASKALLSFNAFTTGKKATGPVPVPTTQFMAHRI